MNKKQKEYFESCLINSPIHQTDQLNMYMRQIFYILKYKTNPKINLNVNLDKTYYSIKIFDDLGRGSIEFSVYLSGMVSIGHAIYYIDHIYEAIKLHHILKLFITTGDLL